MKLNRKTLLLFGPITLVIEWTGLVVGSMYAKGFDTNRALSTLSTASEPLPFIFGMTLTLAGFTYFLFSLALADHDKKIPVLGAISGILFALTGWLPYSGDGGTFDILHNAAIYASVTGYVAMIWLVRGHDNHKVHKLTVRSIRVIVAATVIALVSMLVIGKYEAIAELLVLITIQVWTILLVWHSRNELRA